MHHFQQFDRAFKVFAHARSTTNSFDGHSALLLWIGASSFLVVVKVYSGDSGGYLQLPPILFIRLRGICEKNFDGCLE